MNLGSLTHAFNHQPDPQPYSCALPKAPSESQELASRKSMYCGFPSLAQGQWDFSKSRETPTNHRCFKSSSGGFIPPSGIREAVAKKGLQGDHDQPLLPSRALLQGWLLPGGSRALLRLREPGPPAGGVKSGRSQAPAPARKGVPGVRLCPGKSWKDVWDRDWLRLHCPASQREARMG